MVTSDVLVRLIDVTLLIIGVWWVYHLINFRINRIEEEIFHLDQSYRKELYRALHPPIECDVIPDPEPVNKDDLS